MHGCRSRIALFLLLGPIATFAFAQATVSLKAIAINGFPIPPASVIAVLPNDLITVEIYLQGWDNPPFDGATGLLSEYHLTLASSASIHSSGFCGGLANTGLILPYGWDAPLQKDECPCSDPRYPVCNQTFGCVGISHHPEWMAAIESGQFGRVDAVFYPRPQECAVNASSLNIEWACAPLDPGGESAMKCQGGPNHGATCTSTITCPAGVCTGSFQHYAGTLYLKAGEQVCGTFTYTLQADTSATYLANGQAYPVVAMPSVQPLTLFVPRVCTNPTGACCTSTIYSATCETACIENCVDSNQRFGGVGSQCASLEPACEQVNGPIRSEPAHCTVDVQIPHEIGNPAGRFGHSQISLTFANPIGASEDGPKDFDVSQIPESATPLPPAIAQVQVENPNTVSLHFSEPIHPNRWTCVRHVASNTRMCLGYLPGDAGGNLIVQPMDILTIIDGLNGILNPPLPVARCDIDRSGRCTPADLVSEIDLLNGANGFGNQFLNSIPACPSSNP